MKFATALSHYATHRIYAYAIIHSQYIFFKHESHTWFLYQVIANVYLEVLENENLENSMDWEFSCRIHILKSYPWFLFRIQEDTKKNLILKCFDFVLYTIAS